MMGSMGSGGRILGDRCRPCSMSEIQKEGTASPGASQHLMDWSGLVKSGLLGLELSDRGFEPFIVRLQNRGAAEALQSFALLIEP